MSTNDIKKIGLKLFQMGLNHAHSGNISFRDGNNIFITRTGSALEELAETDIVMVGIEKNEQLDKNASMELVVHRAIYQSNDKIRAVVHAHSPYSIVQAHNATEVIPYDDEGRYYLKNIPVLTVTNSIASSEVVDNITNYTNTYKSIIIARHGVFSWAENLEKAYQYLSVTEASCKINYLLDGKK